ncbi:MAG: ribonuclease III [Coriobacteriia bacterium]|nr:ribonuclease III [Coriobacteriia bacterium]
MAIRISEKEIDARLQRAEELLGHHFADRALLRQALTHASATEGSPEDDYERLEFLGDAVVGFLIADTVFEQYPAFPEGDLTKLRVAVINGSFLTEVMLERGFAELIIFGASEQGVGSRGLPSALEDIYESCTAALYLDSGLNEAKRWVLDTLGPYLDPELLATAASPKSRLQEIMQEQGRQVSYSIVNVEGPAHAPCFTAAALIDGAEKAQGSGSSKKEAESAAAALVLERLVG